MNNVDLYNLFLFVAFVLLALFWRKKQKSLGVISSQVLSIPQTTQLKGLAILCVVIGHFWVHVVQQTPFFLFGGDAVALFLMLSGFGITVSAQGKSENAFIFLKKRGVKVLIPYWFSTIFILLLDYFLLGRTYTWQNYALTSLGINLNSTVRNIDYVRWYITFQLFWYLVFTVFRYCKGYIAIACIVAVPAVLFVFDYYVTHFGWYQIFAFPAGVLLGLFYEPVKNFFNRHVWLLTCLSCVMFCCILVFKIYSYQVIEPYIPSIVFKAVREGTSILLCLCMICIFALVGRQGRVSVFLTFLGGISYEIFLLHGPFLVKYNPVIYPGRPVTVLLGLGLYLVLMVILALGFKKIVGVVNHAFV